MLFFGLSTSLGIYFGIKKKTGKVFSFRDVVVLWFVAIATYMGVAVLHPMLQYNWELIPNQLYFIAGWVAGSTIYSVHGALKSAPVAIRRW